MRTVSFEYTGTVELTENELWPDGDAPENWMLDDVLAVIAGAGGKIRILRDWNLADALELEVRDGPRDGADGFVTDWRYVP